MSIAKLFWGVEVKANKPCKVSVEQGCYIHFSRATLGDIKNDNGTVTIHIKVGDKKLVIGMLSCKTPQLSFDLFFNEDFEISHNWKNGSIHLVGYNGYLDAKYGSSKAEKKDKNDDYDSSEEDDDNSSEDESEEDDDSCENDDDSSEEDDDDSSEDESEEEDDSCENDDDSSEDDSDEDAPILIKKGQPAVATAKAPIIKPKVDNKSNLEVKVNSDEDDTSDDEDDSDVVDSDEADASKEKSNADAGTTQSKNTKRATPQKSDGNETSSEISSDWQMVSKID